MFFKTLSLYTLAICISLYLGSQAADENNAEQTPPTEVNINDTILEFFHNCTCIPFYLCSSANKYMFALRANFLPKEIQCTNQDYSCCKNTTEIEPDLTPETNNTVTKPTTEPPVDVTTVETPTIRHWGQCKSCGLATTFIDLRILTTDTEAANTIPGEVPWMVEIFQKKKNDEQPYRFKCPGTLIHSKVVLTAAHCIVSVVKKPETLKIVATGREIFQNVGVRPDDERNVKTIIKHPEYYSGGLYNDIALLILEKEYNFTDSLLNSICLPKVNQTFDGRRCLAVGWGRNLNLESLPLSKVDVPVIAPKKCQELLRKTHLGPDFNLHTSFMCAGGEEGKDTCRGDGGGPLMCLGDEYQFVQAGIVSWGVEGKCGVVDQPGIYVDVSQFNKWITDELNKLEITFTCS